MTETSAAIVLLRLLTVGFLYDLQRLTPSNLRPRLVFIAWADRSRARSDLRLTESTALGGRKESWAQGDGGCAGETDCLSLASFFLIERKGAENG